MRIIQKIRLYPVFKKRPFGQFVIQAFEIVIKPEYSRRIAPVEPSAGKGQQQLHSIRIWGVCDLFAMKLGLMDR